MLDYNLLIGTINHKYFVIKIEKNNILTLFKLVINFIKKINYCYQIKN